MTCTLSDIIVGIKTFDILQNYCPDKLSRLKTLSIATVVLRIDIDLTHTI